MKRRLLLIVNLTDSKISWEMNFWACFRKLSWLYYMLIEVWKPCPCGYTIAWVGSLIVQTELSNGLCLLLSASWLQIQCTPAVWGFCCLGFPSMMEHSLEMWARINPFSLKLFWPEYFLTTTGWEPPSNRIGLAYSSQKWIVPGLWSDSSHIYAQPESPRWSRLKVSSLILFPLRGKLEPSVRRHGVPLSG